MATAKKSTAKSKSASKPAVKKTPAKKVAATKTSVKKKPAVKKVSAKQTTKMRSFRIAKEGDSFTTFKITRQTVYWTILICFIIFVQLWILKLQIEVSSYLESQIFLLENGL